MELGSTSLSTIACSGYGNFPLQRDNEISPIRRPFGFCFYERMERIQAILVKLDADFRAQCRRALLDELLPETSRTLILEAIKQCEVKDVKLVVLSEEFFTSRWPIVVSAVVLLSFVYLYLIGYIDRGGSTAGSSGSLDFRDIYISIVLFQAAYVWIKFRDVIPRGAVYHRRDSNKFEPRIKFPVPRGVGGKSKRVPLGLYDTFAEAEVAYRIASFYCNESKHHLDGLDLGGGPSFSIPPLILDTNLPYEEKVKQVRVQVLKVRAAFEEQKVATNLSPRVPRLVLEMATGEGYLLASSPIQQLRQPCNSRMDSAMQDQGAQLSPNIHNGIDFNNPGSAVLAKTLHELLDARKQIECLEVQVSQMEVEKMGWEIKHSELERENGLLNHQITRLESQLRSHHLEQQFDTDGFFEHGE